MRSELIFRAPTHSDVIAVLAAVKAEPWRAREVRGLDGHCARRWLRCAGRDGRMGSAGAEQKDEVRREGAAGNVSTGGGVFAPWRDALHRLRSATGSRGVCEGAY